MKFETQTFIEILSENGLGSSYQLQKIKNQVSKRDALYINNVTQKRKHSISSIYGNLYKHVQKIQPQHLSAQLRNHVFEYQL